MTEDKNYKAIKSVIEYYDDIDYMLKNSLSVYDQALYYLRQEYFRCRDLNWTETPKYPSKNKLVDLVKETEEFKKSAGKFDYNAKKYAVWQALTAWKSYINELKDFKEHPEKYNGIPQMPKYKHRTKKYNKFIIDFTRFRGNKEDEIIIPCCGNRVSIKIPKHIKKEWIVQIEINYRNGRYFVSFIYDDDLANNIRIHEHENYGKLDESKRLSLDLGVKNIVAGMTLGLDNDESFIIRGNYIKNFINNIIDKVAIAQSDIMKYEDKNLTKISKKNGELVICKQSNYLNELWTKYNNVMFNFVHNLSNMIIDYCLDNCMGTIVVGYNENWKQHVNMGKQNNKLFCHVPHSRIIHTLKQKCKESGIKIIIVEESYTSKCDHLAFEEMKHHDVYLGKRVKRGMFMSSIPYKNHKHKMIHGDINGCIGMLRKAKLITDAELISLRERGDIVSPKCVKLRGFSY